MSKMPIFGLGLANGQTTVITAKLLTNIYCELRPQGEKSAIVGMDFPGLDLFCDVGASPWRGLIAVEQNDFLYGVNRAVFKEVNNAGIVVDRGMLNTSVGTTEMAHNGTQVMVIDGINGYIYNTQTNVFVQITDIDFPANPTSLTFQDGYFIVGLDNGKFFISGLYDGLVWDSLDFTTVNATAGRLVRVFSDHGELITFQDIATSFYGNSGAADFPFDRIQGADAEWGLAARESVVKFDDSVAFLCRNRMGEVLVGKLSGHSFQQISNPDLDKIINSYAVTSDAIAYSYLLGGHPMYQINFPSAGFSWSYDGTTSIWSKRKSQDITRQICERGVPYLSKIVMSDYNNGRLYKLNPLTLTENGSIIETEIIGEHWDNELQFQSFSRIRLDIEVGNSAGAYPTGLVYDSGTMQAATNTSITLRAGAVGIDDYYNGMTVVLSGRTATITDYVASTKVATTTAWGAPVPSGAYQVIDYRDQQVAGATVMLSLSRDDGKTWGSEQWKTTGLLGEYERIVEWRRCGTSRRMTTKFRMTDPFRKVITGCYVNNQN